MPSNPTLEDLAAFFASDFPQSTVTVVSVGEGRACVRQAIEDQHLRPGGTVSGPTMMAAADAAAYAALLHRIGIVPLAVTSNLSISFLRKPAPHRAILAEARLLKVGRKLAFVEISITSEGDDALVAHATATYVIPES